MSSGLPLGNSKYLLLYEPFEQLPLFKFGSLPPYPYNNRIRLTIIWTCLQLHMIQIF